MNIAYSHSTKDSKGRLHSKGGLPAKLVILSDGTAIMEYYRHGLRHNEKGSAVTITGHFYYEMRYYLNGVLCLADPDRPSLTWSCEPHETIECRYTDSQGRLHRDDGLPAVETHSSGYGELLRKEYWVHGEKVP